MMRTSHLFSIEPNKSISCNQLINSKEISKKQAQKTNMLSKILLFFFKDDETF